MLYEVFMNDTSISFANLALGMGNVVRTQVLRELAAGELLLMVELSELVGGTVTLHGRQPRVSTREW